MNGEKQVTGIQAPPQQGGKSKKVCAGVDNCEDTWQRSLQPQEQAELAALQDQGIGGILIVI
jgi:hypothetical protein